MEKERLIKFQKTRLRIIHIKEALHFSMVGAVTFLVGSLILSHLDLGLSSVGINDLGSEQSIGLLKNDIVHKVSMYLMISLIPIIGFLVQLYSYMFSKMMIKKEKEKEAIVYYEFNCKSFKIYQISIILISIIGLAIPKSLSITNDILMILATMTLCYLCYLQIKKAENLKLKD